MVANTGTFDSPFHRYADGKDLAGLRLSRWRICPAGRSPAVCGWDRDRRGGPGRVGRSRQGVRSTAAGRALADRSYAVDHPFLIAAAAEWLVKGARRWSASQLQYRDSAPARGRCIALLAAEIPICEHMRGLGQLPDSGFRFSPYAEGRWNGDLPVRAFAVTTRPARRRRAHGTARPPARAKRRRARGPSNGARRRGRRARGEGGVVAEAAVNSGSPTTKIPSIPVRGRARDRVVSAEPMPRRCLRRNGDRGGASARTAPAPAKTRCGRRSGADRGRQLDHASPSARTARQPGLVGAWKAASRTSRIAG